MEIPSFFCYCFYVLGRSLVCSELFEKGERVLRFDTYASCERAMINAAEQSPITKGFHIVQEKYGTKIVRVVFPMGLGVHIRVMKSMGEQCNRDDKLIRLWGVEWVNNYWTNAPLFKPLTPKFRGELTLKLA